MRWRPVAWQEDEQHKSYVRRLFLIIRHDDGLGRVHLDRLELRFSKIRKTELTDTSKQGTLAHRSAPVIDLVGHFGDSASLDPTTKHYSYPMESIQKGEEVPTASVWVWIGLSVIAAISFWCQATVTEERFVPALNILSDVFQIPDDVAGATLMAAGASSPELFSSFVALFITHSSLGLGTVVGSEIFNELIICAGAVFAAKSGKLELDKAIVIREVFFYALGIVLLYLALQDTQPVDDDVEDHIFISFPEACMVFSGYIAYVLVCAYMDKVVAFFTRLFQQEAYGKGTAKVDYGSIRYATQASFHIEKMPFLQERHSISHEPAGNFKSVELYRTHSGGDHSVVVLDKRTSSGASQGEGLLRDRRRGSLGNTLRRMASRASERGSTFKRFEFLMHTEKPSDEHALYDGKIVEYKLWSVILTILTHVL